MCVCVCVCVCARARARLTVCEEYNDYIIYYFDGFNVYMIFDLVKRGVSARCGAIEMTTVIVISVEQTHKRLKRT